MPRRRPDFEPGLAGAEAAKLKKFSDAGGSQKQWLPDAGRNQFLKLFVYISVICLTGCMANNSLQYDAVAHTNLYHIAKLRKGMSEKEVLQIMRKPYNYESFVVCDEIYDVWFYVTRPTGLDQTRMVPQNLTPLTFKNGVLVGTGYYWYYYAMKEKADETAAQSPYEPRVTEDQEDAEFENLLRPNSTQQPPPAPTTPAAEPQHHKGTPPSFIQRVKKSDTSSLSLEAKADSKVKVGMTDTEVTDLLGPAQTYESYTLNNDVYEVWFYGNPEKPLIFKNGRLVSMKMEYYHNIKQTATPNRIDSYDRETERMEQDESEQNFDYW